MRTLPGTVSPAHSHLGFVFLITTGLLLAIVFITVCDLSAQDGSTTLQGIIEDSTGARIPSAAITVTDPSRGIHLKTVTDAQGMFHFAILPPGRYDVTASAQGMATRTSRGIELLVGGVSVVQLRLSPAGPTRDRQRLRGGGPGGDANR